MPFGTYEVSEQVAYDNAIRFLKEGSMDAVKLEGGLIRAKTVKYATIWPYLQKKLVAITSHLHIPDNYVSYSSVVRS